MSRIKSKTSAVLRRIVQKVLHNELDPIRESLAQQQQTLDRIQAGITSHDSRVDELRKKLKEVEHYQPIYGVAGVVDTPARESRDRCDVILDSLGDVAGARILDIGSSLGYVSFFFADRGAYVEGWESNVENAEVARLVSNINGIRTNFVTKEFNLETVDTIQENFFDVVIVLSVFHHIIRFQGLQATQKLVKSLLEKAPVMIVELAKKGEDKNLVWDASQPENELDIFAGLDVNITKIGSFGNHLSDNKRPMYKIETKKAVEVNGRKYTYDSTSLVAYNNSPLRRIESFRRKYYFSKDIVIKEYGQQTGIEKHFNLPEAQQEIAALSALRSLAEKEKLLGEFPELIDAEVTPKYSRIVISKVKGKLLSDIADGKTQANIKEKEVITKRVIADVLQQLSHLEQIGLFHNDVRAWNIVVNDEKALLIDYGNTSQIRTDNDLVGLLVAIGALWSGANSRKEPIDELPEENIFKDSQSAKKFYQLIKRGVKSPSEIINQLQTSEPSSNRSKVKTKTQIQNK